MKYFLNAAVLAILLGGCSTVQQNAAQAAAESVGAAISTVSPGIATDVKHVEADARLFCGVAAVAGPITVAIVDATSPTLAPVMVTSKVAVDAACAVAGGIPVVPPPAGAVVPTVAITPPALAKAAD